MTMIATVIQVDRQSLLVRNEENGEEVLVFTNSSDRFSVGDRIRITFSGQMTKSIPPQITAISIERVPHIPRPPFPQPTPSEISAIILQKGRNQLEVRNIQNRQRIRVVYHFAHHFCIGQRVIVKYDTITMSNPPRITATDIIPIC